MSSSAYEIQLNFKGQFPLSRVFLWQDTVGVCFGDVFKSSRVFCFRAISKFSLKRVCYVFGLYFKQYDRTAKFSMRRSKLSMFVRIFVCVCVCLETCVCVCVHVCSCVCVCLAEIFNFHSQRKTYGLPHLCLLFS